ncbi:MAG: hypothetical protein MJZ90_06010 [Bacteroidales bacterium]|nr:hypothetical protein [Bacteroidales bacterium]
MNALLINLLSIVSLDGKDISGIIFFIGIFCAAIIEIIFESNRKKHKIDKQAEIIHEAIQKGGTENINVSEIVGAFNDKKKTLKLTIIKNLKAGLICSLIGLGLIVVALLVINNVDLRNVMYVGGGVLVAVGVAFVITFFISKSYLAKEIEAEERKLTGK